MSISRFHVPIMGFTQDKSRGSGLEKLWRKLREVVSLEDSSLVHPQVWNADFDALAEFIWRNGTTATVVNIYAYSWGCGHGFVKLAKALQARGIQVPKAVLCDPVFHQWWRPWRGLFHASLNPPIVVPSNVWHVDSFYQRLNTPQGTTLELKNPAAQQSAPVLLECTHQYMDDADEFHRKVLEVAEMSARRKSPEAD
jgi:hypothetical protein